jgi:hypothetical protein
LEGKPASTGRALLATMENSLDLMRKHLARIERAIALERERQRESLR